MRGGRRLSGRKGATAVFGEGVNGVRWKKTVAQVLVVSSSPLTRRRAAAASRQSRTLRVGGWWMVWVRAEQARLSSGVSCCSNRTKERACFGFGCRFPATPSKLVARRASGTHARISSMLASASHSPTHFGCSSRICCLSGLDRTCKSSLTVEES